MATRKISKTLPSSNNKRNNQSTARETGLPVESESTIDPRWKEVLQMEIPNGDLNLLSREQRSLIQSLLVPDSPTNDSDDSPCLSFHLLSSRTRKSIARDVLLDISSAKWDDDCPESGEDDDDSLVGNHFAWRSSQINTDLTVAAHCEMEGDIYLEDEDFFNLFRSDMYWNLRQTFMEDAVNGDGCSLLKVVWRAYKAGQASPDRLIPDTNEARIKRNRQRHAERVACKERLEAVKLLEEMKRSD